MAKQLTEAQREANRKKNKPKIDAWEKACIEKSGFYVHLVPNDSDYPTKFNAHTHGLNHLKVKDKIIKHHDLQMVCPVPDGLIMYVFHAVVALIKEGNVFKDGDISNEVLEDMPIKFVTARECDRDVLRIIMPDEKGCVERGEMTAPYSKQYDDLPKQVVAIVLTHSQRLLPSKN